MIFEQADGWGLDGGRIFFRKSDGWTRVLVEEAVEKLGSLRADERKTAWNEGYEDRKSEEEDEYDKGYAAGLDAREL